MTATMTSTMQATVKRSDLLKALRHATAAVTKKRTIPVMSGALLEATPEGFLTVRTTDLELAVQIPIPAQVSNPGAFVVPVRDFLNLLTFCLAEEVDLSQDGEELRVRAGEDEFTLCGFYPDKFPAVPDDEHLPFFVIGRSDLNEMANALAPVVSKDESKPWLCGIHIKATEQVRAISTDGVRIAAWTKPLAVDTTGEAIIPAAAFKLAATLAAPGEELAVSINPGKRIKITGHDFTVWSRIIEGAYPDIFRLVPSEYPGSITVDRQKLITALRAAKVMSKNGETKFSMEAGGIRLQAQKPERGTFSRKLAGTVATNVDAIGFGADMLFKPLENLLGAEVRFELSGSRNPARVTCADQPHLCYVVLPLISF